MEPEGKTPNLDSLIAKAQRLNPEQVREAPVAATPSVAVELDVFLAGLRNSRLLNPEEIDSLEATIDAEDSETFARALIARKKITPFQAKALLYGKWKGLVLGNYVLLEKLGQGGMGYVFKARHRRMSRVVCLKVPHPAGMKSPEYVARFRREAQTAAKLNHPNIVVAHDAGESGSIQFLVMELISGRDLARRVATDGPLSVTRALPLIRQIAMALDYAHEQGVIHRDIKPHNLLLDDSGTIKILDMGLARFDSYLGENPDASTHSSMTTSGVIMGTVDYLSPEQALNSRHSDRRSDIYSLGCTLHFLLTGKVLFDGETMMEKLVAHRERKAPRLGRFGHRIPAVVEAIFQRMVAKDPAERYPTMGALVDDLDLLATGKTPLTCRKFGRRGSPASRFALAGGLVVVLCVVLALLAFWPPARTWLSASGGAASDANLRSPPPGATESPGEAAGTTGGGSTSAVSKVGVSKVPGKKRALVIIPFFDFSSSDLSSVLAAVKSHGIEVTIASTERGRAMARGKKHAKATGVNVDLTLWECRLEDFDGVVVCGGDVTPFTKNAGLQQTMREIIGNTFVRGRTVAVVSEGAMVIKHCGAMEHLHWEKHGDLQVGTSKEGRPGRIISAPSPKYAGPLIVETFGVR